MLQVAAELVTQHNACLLIINVLWSLSPWLAVLFESADVFCIPATVCTSSRILWDKNNSSYNLSLKLLAFCLAPSSLFSSPSLPLLSSILSQLGYRLIKDKPKLSSDYTNISLIFIESGSIWELTFFYFLCYPGIQLTAFHFYFVLKHYVQF